VAYAIIACILPNIFRLQRTEVIAQTSELALATKIRATLTVVTPKTVAKLDVDGVNISMLGRMNGGWLR